MNFTGDDVQKGLFYAVGRLPLSSGDTASTKSKVESLQLNVKNVKEYLELNDLDKAKNWLHRVFPEAV
jgi:hypothetical protein